MRVSARQRYYNIACSDCHSRGLSEEALSSSMESSALKSMPKKAKSKSAQKRILKAANAMQKARQSFDERHIDLFGEKRWKIIVNGLQRPVKHCALGNKWSDAEAMRCLLQIEEGESVPFLPNYFDSTYIRYGAGEKWPAPSLESSLDRRGLCCYYPLDAASLLPVRLLQLQAHHHVLDICAAPGGKSLAILQHLEKDGRLICSDVSKERLARLQRTMRSYLPEEVREQMVRIIAGDGTMRSYCERVGYRSFDRVLLDAPCSSERHVLQQPAELLKWSPGRSKINAKRQVRLLLNALRLCKVGGRVVYSTCSLSDRENDLVVSKVLRLIAKEQMDSPGTCDADYHVFHGTQFSDMPFGEPTEFGWHVVPDDTNPWGPIYVSVIEVRPKQQS